MEKILQVVGAIFIQDGCLFAARRGDSRYSYVAHKYEFVGGKCEAGESLADALKREVREEMQCAIEVLAPYGSVTHRYPDFAITLHTFLCKMCSDYVLLEHEEARWIPLDALQPDQWAPADKPIIEAIRRDNALRTI